MSAKAPAVKPHGTCQREGCEQPATLWHMERGLEAWACSAACWTLIVHPELAR